MSHRLRNFDRDDIVRRAMKATFEKQYDKFQKKESKLLRRAYNLAFTRRERSLAKKLGPKWFVLDNSLRVVFSNGVSVWLNGRNNFDGDKFPMPRQREHVVITDAKLEAEILELKEAQDKLHQKESEAKVKLRALLNSVTTIDKLLDVWPEGKEFFQSYLVTNDKRNLPAIQVADINDLLGLNRHVGEQTEESSEDSEEST